MKMTTNAGATQADSVSKPVFRDLNVEDDEPETTEVESLCTNCGENGMTRLLLTRIPFYKEIILMSFECSHCGFKNNEIQPGGRIQEKGVQVEVIISNERDLNRQVVKSDYATVKIPEVEFEIPPQSQKGEITTIEGILDRTVAGLQQDQIVRRIAEPEVAEQVDAFIVKLTNLKKLENPFTLIIDDPSGNSYIENLLAPHPDPALKLHYYVRNKEQNHLLCIYEDELREAENPVHEGKDLSGEELENEVLQFPTNCPTCNAPCVTNMKVTNIPFFKEAIIMATTCDACGHRTNEVKSGSGIADKGTRIQLNITDPSDLSRDVLKSETCSFSIPDLDFEMGAGTLGGRFTTLEGLLTAMREQILDFNPLFSGDSADSNIKSKFAELGHQLSEIAAGNTMNVTVVLDDPAGNSYLQNVYAPDPDPNMEIVHYERNFDQNEELGLNDLKVENYESS
uniref:Zinc finger protein ZPR1 n=1 Tax=Lynceus sp. MCZ IZ 141354 TaxID=1930659 RepID=A0A9N6WT16_9CRUS|nr:EOG090X06TU [Lynceus sp. MCZ IZ 141354]